jgi:hypothetical protein
MSFAVTANRAFVERVWLASPLLGVGITTGRTLGLVGASRGTSDAGGDTPGRDE